MSHGLGAPDQTELERRLRSFLAAEAPGATPEPLRDQVEAISLPTRTTIFGSLSTVPMRWGGAWRRGDRPTAGDRWPRASLLWAVLALIGAMLLAWSVPLFIGSADGGRTSTATVQTTATPWLFASSVDCDTHERPLAPEPGPLPEVGTSPVATPGNGPIVALSRFWVTLFIDPDSGATVHEGPRFGVERFVDGVPVAGLTRWSPDGHWIGGTFPTVDETLPERRTFACGDYHLVSSDGSTLSSLRFEGDGDVISTAWSPDARWLATASWSDDLRSIDVVRIEDDGRVSESRRVATAVRGWSMERLAWGPDGTLAWLSSDTDGEHQSIGLLRPGSSEPRAIDLESGLQLINPRWSNDGRVLVAVGKSGPGRGSGIYVVDPVSLTVEAIDLKVRPLADKYAWESEVPTSSDGRVYFPGYGDLVSEQDIYSANLDGSDLRNLTAGPTDDGVDHGTTQTVVLSPDESRLAFQSGDGALLTVGVDGGVVHAVLPRGTQTRWIESWQPIPQQ